MTSTRLYHSLQECPPRLIAFSTMISSLKWVIQSFKAIEVDPACRGLDFWSCLRLNLAIFLLLGVFLICCLLIIVLLSSGFHFIFGAVLLGAVQLLIFSDSLIATSGALLLPIPTVSALPFSSGARSFQSFSTFPLLLSFSFKLRVFYSALSSFSPHRVFRIPWKGRRVDESHLQIALFSSNFSIIF